MIIVAAFALNIAHPGPVFGRGKPLSLDEASDDVAVTNEDVVVKAN